MTLGVAGFASCLLGWPLGAVAIVARREPGWIGRVLAWMACATLVVFLFMHNLVRPDAHPPTAPIFTSLPSKKPPFASEPTTGAMASCYSMPAIT